MEEFLSLVGFLDVDFESHMGPRDFFQVFFGGEERGDSPFAVWDLLHPEIPQDYQNLGNNRRLRIL